MKFKRKILKLNHLIHSELFQKQQKDKIQKINHPQLSAVWETLEQLKNENFTSEDKAVFQNLEVFRHELKNNQAEIDYSVFGQPSRKVSEIYNTAASPEIWSRFHYLLAKNLRAKTYLEVGTNLGVSGSYILSALSQYKDSKFITMEGLNQLSNIAENQFQKIVEPHQFQILRGMYGQTFPELMELPVLFDLLFIDGNHKYGPTLNYFQQLKNKIAKTAVFVFDDIYVGSEMQAVWKKIKADPEVNFTVDLYKLGIVVIDRNENAKGEDFRYFLSR